MNTSVILTSREDQICTGIVLGLCKKEIADSLNVSPRAVEGTVRHILVKINARKSTEIVTYWFMNRFSIPEEALPKSILPIVFFVIMVGSCLVVKSARINEANTICNKPVPAVRDTVSKEVKPQGDYYLLRDRR